MGPFSCGIGNRLHYRLYFYNPEDDALKYNQRIEHHAPFDMIRAPNGTVHSNNNGTNPDPKGRNKQEIGLDHNMNEILPVALSMALILSLGFSANLMIANAQSNSTQYDMKSVTDNINKSLAKLTGGNSSELLDNTMASINKTASEIANQGKDIINEDSLNTAAIIAKKIGIGIADVLSNISGEVKQGILAK
jgi:hypothetical protein